MSGLVCGASHAQASSATLALCLSPVGRARACGLPSSACRTLRRAGWSGLLGARTWVALKCVACLFLGARGQRGRWDSAVAVCREGQGCAGAAMPWRARIQRLGADGQDRGGDPVRWMGLTCCMGHAARRVPSKGRGIWAVVNERG